MSRTAARANVTGRKIEKELEARGVIAMASSRRGLVEDIREPTAKALAVKRVETT